EMRKNPCRPDVPRIRDDECVVTFMKRAKRCRSFRLSGHPDLRFETVPLEGPGRPPRRLQANDLLSSRQIVPVEQRVVDEPKIRQVQVAVEGIEGVEDHPPLP